MKEVFRNLPTLSTSRLILRKIKMEDAESIFEYASRPITSKYTIWDVHKDIRDTRQFIRTVLDKYENNQADSWCIVEKKGSKVIGTCGFCNWKPEHAKAEIGYALSPDYWRKGYTTEAVKKVIEFGFDVMELARMEAICLLDNIGSYKVMEKAGMKYEGILRHYLYAKGQFHDLRIYSIIKSDLDYL